ncbi:MAG: hypothetical protein J6N53_13615, partial [Lachnospiraceae bacterium]|nr:hypothetical protein [Lachnospiraceae bacterium]
GSMDERQRIREGRLMPPPSRRLNDKSLNQILTASKSSLVTAGEISNINDEWDAGWKGGSIWFYKNKQP